MKRKLVSICLTTILGLASVMNVQACQAEKANNDFPVVTIVHQEEKRPEVIECGTGNEFPEVTVVHQDEKRPEVIECGTGNEFPEVTVVYQDEKRPEVIECGTGNEFPEVTVVYQDEKRPEVIECGFGLPTEFGFLEAIDEEISSSFIEYEFILPGSVITTVEEEINLEFIECGF
ncbi:hypothetical protein [[Clostridium] colinum]|uniref:hypothetical protein n=1 Tax=[Clostridium] colinum TaxID=36835 RepID=UPI0020248DC1|nr:hypothetical protein [[Clostridium] colinum]